MDNRSMLERIKTAIFVSADDAHNTWPTPDHPECERMARAAIAAMRDPGEAALEAGRAKIADWQSRGDWTSRGLIGMSFNAIIDTMLKD